MKYHSTDVASAGQELAKS